MISPASLLVARRPPAGESVGERVLHDAPCSVLVVRPEDLGN